MRSSRQVKNRIEDGVAGDFWYIMAFRRNDLELTQRAVGENLGVKPSTICAWEHGKVKRLPLPGKFWALAATLGLSALEMLEAAGYLTEEDELAS